MAEPEPQKTDNSKTKRVLAAVGIVVLLLLVLFVIRAAQQDEPPAPFDDTAPRVSFIKAELAPPLTIYNVFASDLDDQTLTYAWILDTTEGMCLDFTFEGGKATWKHDGPGCSHEDPAGHPGTISVTVSDGKHPITRTYRGGSAAFDPDPLYPEE